MTVELAYALSLCSADVLCKLRHAASAVLPGAGYEIWERVAAERACDSGINTPEAFVDYFNAATKRQELSVPLDKDWLRLVVQKIEVQLVAKCRDDDALRRAFCRLRMQDVT